MSGPADHPVLRVLRERAVRAPERPWRDGHRVAVVLEGGGMRGVISAAMAGSLERAGLTHCFDIVVGTSAGALNAAGLLAGVADACCTAYHTAFTTRRFVNPYRLLIGRAAIDVAYTLDHNDEHLDAERHERTVSNAVPLHCIAVDVETAEPCDLTGLLTADELRQALLASSRMPWIGGEPVPFRGRRWLDGGLAEAIPHRTAVALGATHVLVLQTRPWGVARTAPPAAASWVLERNLRKLNPKLVELYRRRSEDYERTVDEIALATEQPAGEGPFLYGLRLARGAPTVGQLERRASRLRAAADAATRWSDEQLASAGLRSGTAAREL
jgi:predicted patatin/cPLA2 family phospholipase